MPTHQVARLILPISQPKQLFKLLALFKTPSNAQDGVTPNLSIISLISTAANQPVLAMIL